MHLLKGSAVLFEHGMMAGQALPPQHDRVDIRWADLKAVADAIGTLGGNQRRPRAQERIVHYLALFGMVQHRATHQLNRLLSPVPRRFIFALTGAKRV